MRYYNILSIHIIIKKSNNINNNHNIKIIYFILYKNYINMNLEELVSALENDTNVNVIDTNSKKIKKNYK